MNKITRCGKYWKVGVVGSGLKEGYKRKVKEGIALLLARRVWEGFIR